MKGVVGGSREQPAAPPLTHSFTHIPNAARQWEGQKAPEARTRRLDDSRFLALLRSQSPTSETHDVGERREGEGHGSERGRRREAGAASAPFERWCARASETGAGTESGTSVHICIHRHSSCRAEGGLRLAWQQPPASSTCVLSTYLPSALLQLFADNV
eukprot:GHVU01157249.1.p1 GENE.GHVU01157249.1~~GHVU01157249.1.p1  ORF type:complete len:159 (-),score=11.43 GHVU01157249.1:263-739(-)